MNEAELEFLVAGAGSIFDTEVEEARRVRNEQEIKAWAAYEKVVAKAWQKYMTTVQAAYESAEAPASNL